MIFKKNRSKQIIAIFLCFLIFFTSFIGSYKKAEAAEWIVAPEIGITVGQVVLTLLGLCGIGIAYDNRQELETAALSVASDFYDFVKERDMITIQLVDEWFEDAKTGTIQLQGRFERAWAEFKAFCVVTYYKVGFNIIVADNRPNITSLPLPTEMLSEFLGYYTNTESYPYYFVVNRTDGKGLTSANSKGASSVFAVFDSVPMLYLQNGELKYLYIADGGVGHSTVVMEGYMTRTGNPSFNLDIFDDVRDFPVDGADQTLFSYLFEHGLDIIQSNIPVFDSYESAYDWWTKNVTDGVISTPNDIPVWDIPNTGADVIWGRDQSLDNYDVIGGNSYVDENGNVIPGGVAVPGWDTLIDVNTGGTTWDDAIGDSIPIDRPTDGTLEDATDIPITKDDTDVGEDDKTDSKPIVDSLPNTTGIALFIADLKGLFPFCIPFDLIDCIRLFNAEAKAPYFEIPISFEPFIDDEYVFVIDLSIFDDIAALCRVLFTILFLIGLAAATPKLIKF